jgi:hypothetical protein
MRTLSLVLVLTHCALSQAQSRPWDDVSKQNRFQHQLFFDDLEWGKINRLARDPWNRAQSALAELILAKQNLELNAAKSSAEADKIVRATVAGLSNLSNTQQQLFMMYSTWQIDIHNENFTKPTCFWNSAIIVVPLGYEIATWDDKRFESVTKISPPLPLAKIQRLGFPKREFDGNTFAIEPKKPIKHTYTDDTYLLQFQEASIYLYGMNKPLPNVKSYLKAAQKQWSGIEKLLSKEEHRIATSVLRKFDLMVR